MLEKRKSAENIFVKFGKIKEVQMSRVGSEPIIIPENVKVEIKGKKVTVTGPKGTLSREMNDGISASAKDDKIFVKRSSDEKKYRSLHGLNRTLINNMIIGTTEGYLKKLMIIGTGYKAQPKENWLILSLGFSHDIYFEIPKAIDVKVEKISRAQATDIPNLQTIIDLFSIDKELLGQVTAAIRSIRPPEPYKGKGIRYEDEHVRKKAGKIAGGTEGV